MGTLQSLTGPVQGFPCVVFPHKEKPVFITGNPILIAGTLFSLQGFPCEKNYTGKTLFSLQGMGLPRVFNSPKCPVSLVLIPSSSPPRKRPESQTILKIDEMIYQTK